MIKLTDILKEIFLSEKIIRVPQEALDKSKEIYDYISKNLENLKSKSEDKNENNPYMDPKLKDYFKLKDLKNQDVKVSIGFYNNPKGGGASLDPTKDFLMFNLAFDFDVEFVEDAIEHELVHAMDPKLKNIQIYQSVAKKGGQYGEDYEKYVKSPWEFDAFTAPLINKLSKNIKKAPSQRDILFNLLSDIKNKSINDILSDQKYEQLPYIFSKKEWDVEKYNEIYNEYKEELGKIKIWATKPTLYKRFIKRLGTEL